MKHINIKLITFITVSSLVMLQWFLPTLPPAAWLGSKPNYSSSSDKRPAYASVGCCYLEQAGLLGLGN